MREKNTYRNLSPAGFEVEVKNNVFIPMPDGIRLRLWTLKERQGRVI
jgi:hypothetical protein